MNIKSSMRSWKTTEQQILLNIHIFWYMTFCHQVRIFPRIVLLSSSESGRPRVPFVAMFVPIKRHSSPPKHQKLLTQQHSVSSHNIRSFIHTAMLTSTLASHLALTLCYQYYVIIIMIIQSIST